METFDEHTNCWGTAPNILLSIYTIVLTITILIHRYVVGRRAKARASRQTANELRAVYAHSTQLLPSSHQAVPSGSQQEPLLSKIQPINQPPPHLRGHERGHHT
jgi:hypothetical protein